MAIDIREHPEVIKTINAILNNNGIAEIKNESKHSAVNLVVVEIRRIVKTEKTTKQIPQR